MDADIAPAVVPFADETHARAAFDAFPSLYMLAVDATLDETSSMLKSVKEEFVPLIFCVAGSSWLSVVDSARPYVVVVFLEDVIEKLPHE